MIEDTLHRDLSFDEIEDAFPDAGLRSRPDNGALTVSAQFLHDFARNINAMAIARLESSTSTHQDEPQPETRPSFDAAVFLRAPILSDEALLRISRQQTNASAAEKYGDTFLRIARAVAEQAAIATLERYHAGGRATL